MIAAGKTLRRSCCRRYSVIPMRVRIRRSGTDWHRASIENQATDTFAAAAASRSDHDDLAARRRDARESPNVRTVRHDKKDSAPGPFVDDRARAGDQRLSLIAQHDQPNVGSASTGPSSSSVAVSMQRHHGELRILSTAIPSDLSRTPILAASARPLTLRLR